MSNYLNIVKTFSNYFYDCPMKNKYSAVYIDVINSTT